MLICCWTLRQHQRWVVGVERMIRMRGNGNDAVLCGWRSVLVEALAAGVHAALTAGCMIRVGGLRCAVLHRSLKKLAESRAKMSFCLRASNNPNFEVVTLYQTSRSEDKLLLPGACLSLKVIISQVLVGDRNACVVGASPSSCTMTILCNPQDPEKRPGVGIGRVLLRVPSLVRPTKVNQSSIVYNVPSSLPLPALTTVLKESKMAST